MFQSFKWTQAGVHWLKKWCQGTKKSTTFIVLVENHFFFVHFIGYFFFKLLKRSIFLYVDIAKAHDVQPRASVTTNNSSRLCDDSFVLIREILG